MSFDIKNLPTACEACVQRLPKEAFFLILPVLPSLFSPQHALFWPSNVYSMCEICSEMMNYFNLPIISPHQIILQIVSSQSQRFRPCQSIQSQPTSQCSHTLHNRTPECGSNLVSGRKKQRDNFAEQLREQSKGTSIVHTHTNMDNFLANPTLWFPPLLHSKSVFGPAKTNWFGCCCPWNTGTDRSTM